ncbi:MAG: ABC transporter ATP-binding protein [Halanaerobiaceae bacterium]
MEFKESFKPIVKVNSVSKKYGRTTALQDAKMEFPEGELTALIGPNGSGKSTLLKTLVGLTYADSGSVEVLGLESRIQLKDKVAFLPEIDHFYNWMTIKQIIDFHNSQFSNFNYEKAVELADEMNLKIESKITSLSKGMRGRLKLVLTMAREVKLYIMDEPLSGLDPQSKGYILEILNNEFATGGKSVILSTHEVIESEKFFDYVIMLENGQVRLQGYADKLREEHNLSIQDLTREVFA